MKKLIFRYTLFLGLLFTSLVAHSQSYFNYNTTHKNYSGYQTDQSYYSKNKQTNVYTNRTYDGSGGYTSSTNVYSNGNQKSSSTTYQDDYGNRTTIKHNYNTGTDTYRYSSPSTSGYNSYGTNTHRRRSSKSYNNYGW